MTGVEEQQQREKGVAVDQKEGKKSGHDGMHSIAGSKSNKKDQV